MDLKSSLTPVEVAELLNITKNTVYELIKRGEIPSYKIGRKIKIDTEDVMNYINSQKKSYFYSNNNNNLSSSITSSNSSSSLSNNNEFIICGHDVILDILARYLEQQPHGYRVLRSYLGSYNGLYELYNNRVSVSSTHLWDCNSNDYNTPFVKMMLPGVPCVLINLAYRNHGLFVKSNNPKNINSWHDLSRDDIKFINREKGSATRILLDEKLNDLNINPDLINGYYDEELSAISCATYVSRGAVDVALGHEKVANQVNEIDFIPLQKERYDLVIKEKDLQSPICQAIIKILNSTKFNSEIQGFGGYDVRDMGKIIANTSRY